MLYVVIQKLLTLQDLAYVQLNPFCVTQLKYMDIETKTTIKNSRGEARTIAFVIVIILIAGYVGYIEYKKIHANDALKQEYQQKVSILNSLNDYYAAHPVSQAQKEADMQAFLKRTAP